MDLKIEYSNHLSDRICHLIASGKSLRSICSLHDMPSRMTINRWREQYPYFGKNYGLAVEEGERKKGVVKEAKEIEKKRGRPDRYSQEIATKICDQIAEGKSLTDIENFGPEWPSKRTINRWLTHKSNYRDDFLLLYERSKQLRAEHFEDKLMAKLRETSLDQENDPKGFKRAQDIKLLQWFVQDARNKRIDFSEDDEDSLDMRKILEDDEQGTALELIEKIALEQAKRAK